jgi:hypothetical protein
MGSDDAARAAARNLLDFRLATAPDYLIPTAFERSLAPPDLRQRALTKMEWREAARVHWLVAEDAVEHPEPSSTGKAWTGRFAHALAQHLVNSAKDYSLERHQAAALLIAAYALQRMLSASEAQRTRRLIDDLPVDQANADWILSLGVSRVQFKSFANLLGEAHKRATHAASAMSELGGRPAGAAPAGRHLASADRPTRVDAPGRTTIVPAPAQFGPATRPAWLVLGQAEAWNRLAAPPSWRPDDDPPQGTRDSLESALAQAWSAFRGGDVAAADDALRPVYAARTG